MPGRRVRTYTIEPRGAAVVLMSWSDEIAAGPVEVRQFGAVETAKAAAEAEAGLGLVWREARGDERKHGVVTAADLP
jgi:hypothetical protein